MLKKSDVESKDQTYFLYGINKEVVEHILFPLQNLESKQETRKIAENGSILVNIHFF